MKQFSWWWVVSALAVGLTLGLGLLAIIQLLAGPFALLILSVAIAMGMATLVDKLENRLKLPRVAAALIVFLGILLIFFGMGWIIVPGLVAQGQAFIERIPALLDRLLDYLGGWDMVDQDSVLDNFINQVGAMATAVIRLPLLLASGLIDVLLILFVALYWVILIPKMSGFFLSLFPEERRIKINDVMSKMGQAMGGYVRGVAIDGLIVAVITYIGLTIIGVEYALVLGMLAGIMEIFPIVGPWIAGTAIVLTALTQSPTTALIALIFVLVLQQIESNVLVPNIMRSQAEISPLLVIIAVFIGATLGGLVGALAAIPLAAALSVLAKEAIAPAIRRATGAEQDPERSLEEIDEDVRREREARIPDEDAD
jgi:predicted PurR-regulated permease PerM